jgi:hypothetical protein
MTDTCHVEIPHTVSALKLTLTSTQLLLSQGGMKRIYGIQISFEEQTLHGMGADRGLGSRSEGLGAARGECFSVEISQATV